MYDIIEMSITKGARMYYSINEFHINKKIRKACGFDKILFASTGNVTFANIAALRIFTQKLNDYLKENGLPTIFAGQLNAMGLLDEIFHYVCLYYREQNNAYIFANLLSELEKKYTKEAINDLLEDFIKDFPPTPVYNNEVSVKDYLQGEALDAGTGVLRSNKEACLEEMLLLMLSNENPAYKDFYVLFDDKRLLQNSLYKKVRFSIADFFAREKPLGKLSHTLIDFLKEPVVASPHSIKGQLDYVRTYWADMLADWLLRILAGMDLMSEEEKAAWQPMVGGPGDMPSISYENLMKEYERFSPDKDWMPRVVLMAKTVLVWLDQLSKKYKRSITRLDQIPDEELDILAGQGFTGLWLIGIWERSNASRLIKQYCGNPEAAASAYSLDDYNIAYNLGGWDALDNLRRRLWARGIRLASDMVPNHTGMDSKWVAEKPDLFMQRRDNPYPQYSFDGGNLSNKPGLGIYLENHYYNHSDCAVVYKRVDLNTGDTRYIYHGNDGTGMPWNDTAQIDFLNPAAREAVIQEIIHVAQNFPIIRFDAAMVLAKKHIRRLWYPEQGHGGDIATRSEYALTTQQFEDAIPNEFWREVVDRIAKEVPDTLLLAEAFWMMEGYFVRTLGMHRVYNSAFMNMLKREDNQHYKETIKNTLAFDPQVLRRFVNFMNNPDEETAVAQFGKGDKYFGVCTLMVTMPGLPMFGHGQIEGFEEKYGMEYVKAYRDEKPDTYLVDRHYRQIFPLIRKRYIFSEVEYFELFDVYNNGKVNENIFAYFNNYKGQKSLVFYNNKYDMGSGWIKQSCPKMYKNGEAGELRTKNISACLELDDKNEKQYVLFNEFHSGLWFIRKASDIIQNGIFVSLNGFENQILLEWNNVTDTVDNRYSILCTRLNGAGCQSIDIAWQKYIYEDLYKALKDFVAGDLLDNVQLWKEDKLKLKSLKVESITCEKLLKLIEDKAIAFYKIAKVKDENKAYATFAKQLKSLYKMLTEQSDNELEKYLATGLKSSEHLTQIFASFLAIACLPQKDIIECGLLRELGEILSCGGINKATADDTLKRLSLLFEVRELKFNTSSSKKDISKIVSIIMASSDAYFLCGKNNYNGIDWYNKEKFEQTLLVAMLESSIAVSEQKLQALTAFYKKLMASCEEAQYKCEGIIKDFVIPPATKKATTKKHSSKNKKASLPTALDKDTK